LPAVAENPVPESVPAARYAALLEHSPFAVATAVAETPTSQPTFAANWFVSGAARIGAQNFVTIQSRDLGHQFSLFDGEVVEDVSLVEVNWSDEVGKSTVILRKGAETAKLEFNEAQIRGQGATPVAAAAPASPASKLPGASVNPKPVRGRLQRPVIHNIEEAHRTAMANQASEDEPQPALPAGLQPPQISRRPTPR
jgi:hypothetical protein